MALTHENTLKKILFSIKYEDWNMKYFENYFLKMMINLRFQFVIAAFDIKAFKMLSTFSLKSKWYMMKKDLNGNTF